MRYSIKNRDQTCIKGYGILDFAKNMGKNLSSKQGKNLLDSTKQSATNAFEKGDREERVKARRSLVRNKIKEKITKAASDGTHGAQIKSMASTQ